MGTSSQGGGIGRYFASLYNQEKDNNKFKNKHNQNCQKIELYRSPTTKELKKKHSSRLIGGADTGSQGREDSQKGGSWRTEANEVAAGRVGSPTFACR